MVRGKVRTLYLSQKTDPLRVCSSTHHTKTNSHWTNSVADKPATLREMASPNVMKIWGKYVKVRPISQVQNAGLKLGLREQLRRWVDFGVVSPSFCLPITNLSEKNGYSQQNK
jgi:hypothetical protein